MKGETSGLVPKEGMAPSEGIKEFFSEKGKAAKVDCGTFTVIVM